jgi:hypothetical protein
LSIIIIVVLRSDSGHDLMHISTSKIVWSEVKFRICIFIIHHS